MARAQRRVLLVAGAVAVLMLLFPPWETFGGHYLGHAPIISPPSYDGPQLESQRWALPSPDPIARVSLPLLAGQAAVLLASAGAAFLLLAPARK